MGLLLLLLFPCRPACAAVAQQTATHTKPSKSNPCIAAARKRGMVNEMDNGRQGTKPKPATPASLSHFDRIAQSVANAAAYGPSNASIEASLEVDTVTKAKDKASAGKLGATPQHCRCYKK